jgi:hypothetical protein
MQNAKSRKGVDRGSPRRATFARRPLFVFFILHFAFCIFLSTPLPAQTAHVIDDFNSTDSWRALPADGVSLEIHPDEGFAGRGMRMDIDFQGRGGFVIARRAVDLTLPENYELTFRVRGDLPRNNLEFKLIDESGENVWWLNQRNFEFTPEWQLVRIKKRHIAFAWGPAGGGEMKRVASIEFAISVGNGGKGSIWIDELTFRPREPERPYDRAPVASATAGEGTADRVLDRDDATSWETSSPRAALTLDFTIEREYGGAVIRWGTTHATDYDVEASNDGSDWIIIRRVRGANGETDFLFLPESESRYLRFGFLESSGEGFEIREIDVQPLEFASSKTEFFHRIAAAAPPGHYPRYLGRTQSFWTVAGAPADEEEILINEDGMIELGGVGGFSVEPFVRLGSSGPLVTWADVERRPSLARGTLPVPSVTWVHPSFDLEVTALAGGEPGRSAARASYEIRNSGLTPLEATLYVAVRPFQVNPPWQFLNIVGGFAEIATLEWDGLSATVNRGRALTPSPAPAAFGATTFDGGSIVEYLANGALPAPARVDDEFRAASGAFAWEVRLQPGESRSVALDVPLHPGAPKAPPEAEIVEGWSRILGEARIDLPPSAMALEQTIQSTLAYILVNQDGAAIQPGSRAYDRSWIRDGSLTSAALLRFGLTAPVKRFIEWYAPFQYPSGKVPCCVGKRGGDPVPEHDSHGQLIFLIAEYVRHTGDLELARSLWPHVEGAVGYIDELRRLRVTAEYRTPEKRAYYGLLPESISHEGYSAKPMHSYWDQLFALKGLEDASWLAGVLGIDGDGIDAVRNEYRRDLAASFVRAMAMHGIDYLPGSVELGDFDATSTTIALEPVEARAILPEGALERTFEKYWQNFEARRDGTMEWNDYTPYELRVVGSFIRLGWIGRAHEALSWFMDHRRPAAWNHWAEVVWRDPATPKFIGDMPHTWVGSDFLRSVADFFAYEATPDRSLVIAAGIPESWAREGVAVTNLRTHYGPLSYSIRDEGGSIRLKIARGTTIPPGGIVVEAPFSPRRVIRSLPAEVVLAPRRTEVKR